MGWEWVYFLIASIVIQAVFTPKNSTAAKKPEAFTDIDFPQATEGTPQTVIFGDCWMTDWTVLDVGNYRTTPIKSKGASKK